MLYHGSRIRERITALTSILCGILATLTSVSSLSAGTVTLAWDPSPDASVVAYKVYYGPTSRSYTNSIQVGNVTNASIAGLIAGATYYFGATALDSSGLESDFSNETLFTVPVPVGNQSPTLTALANVTINESAGLQTVNLAGITSGATNETQTLAVTATSSNLGLIPNPTVNYNSPNSTGSITFTPVALAFGSAIVSVTVNDGGASNNVVSRSFTVTVNPVNQAPTLTALANVSINEGDGVQSVSLAGITSGATNETQTLMVTATSSNPSLVPSPTVNYTSPNVTGSIAFTPVALAFGSATLTVTVNDGGASNNIASRSFTVTVNPVNQSPTLTALADVTINEGASLQTVNLVGITSGATNETQTLTFTATSSNPSLIPNPTVTYTSPNATGTIAFTPVALAFGSATLTVTVNDGGASNNIVARSFTVTVNSVNQSPTLNTLANVTISEGAGLQTVSLAGMTSGATNETQTLTVTATSSNPSVIPNPTVNYTSPNATGTIAFTPVALASGSATLTVSVNDGGASNNIVSRSFTVTVNQLPTISPIADQVIAVDTATAVIPFTIGDAETSVSSLTITASSSNLSLVQNADIVFGGAGSNRTLAVTPLPGQTGFADITITVSDGTGSASRTFLLDVKPKPTAPGNLRVAQALP
jgi:class 3 adenylate cyclase